MVKSFTKVLIPVIFVQEHMIFLEWMTRNVWMEEMATQISCFSLKPGGYTEAAYLQALCLANARKLLAHKHV